MSPYLLWPNRARSHLLNGQGLLQLGAECSSVVPDLALPGLPATKKREQVFSGVALGPVRGNLGKSRACTCRATPERGTAHTAAPPWPAEVARGVASVWQEEPGENGKASEDAPPPTR